MKSYFTESITHLQLLYGVKFCSKPITTMSNLYDNIISRSINSFYLLRSYYVIYNYNELCNELHGNLKGR